MRIDWRPQVEYERLVLTVTGPGELYLRQEVETGQTPSLSLFDRAGKPFPDGGYTYELRLAPRLDRQKHAEPAKLPSRPLVQSGTFVIEHGELVTGRQQPESSPIRTKSADRAAATQATPEAQKILTDLVVNGHACIGASCTVVDSNFPLMLKNSPSSGILFDAIPDPPFSSHDWLVQINPLGIGDRFYIRDLGAATIPFVVSGSAPDYSIFVRDNGDVGLGTATPAKKIHMVKDSTPTIRLEQSGPLSIPYTWEVGANESNFFVRDVTNASSLPLQILAGAPTNSLVVGSTGRVGLGVAAPAKRLTIKSAGGNDDVVQVIKSSGSSPIYRLFETTAGDGLFSVFDNTGSEAARLTSVSGGKLALGCNVPEHRLDLGNVPGAACSTASARSFIDAGSTIFTASSSRTIKENLTPVQVPEILDKISAVGVYNYDFIEGPKDKIGLMAEDFHTVFGRGSDKMLNGQEVEMALWLAVQELTAQNKQLTAQNQRLTAQNDELVAQNQDIDRRLQNLEARLVAAPAP